MAEPIVSGYESPMMKALGISPEGIVSNVIHDSSSKSPRGAMGRAIVAQSRNWPKSLQEAYAATPVSKQLFLQRNQGLRFPEHPALGGVPFPAYAVRGGSRAYVSPEIRHFDKGSMDVVSQFGYGSIANHEMEHAHRQPPKMTGAVDHTVEVGPSIGDIVFRAEQFAREQGKPLKHLVALPGGVRHDVNWMRQQARDHGYWDRRSMTDLIFNTTEGRQWYKRMVDGERDKTEAILNPPKSRPQPVISSNKKR